MKFSNLTVSVTIPLVLVVQIYQIHGAVNHTCTTDSNNSKPTICNIEKNNSSSAIQSHTFVFEWSTLAPDNYAQQVITINGQFPGPNIRIQQNTTLIINVINQLDRGFVLHFHGIHQFGSLTSDGVPQVTQAEIPVGGCYRYELFTGTQVGTFHYHAHTRFDMVWAFGALIIEDDPATIIGQYKYDEERVLLLSQDFHEHIDDIFHDIFQSPFPDIPDPASLLINGKSWGIWYGVDANTDGYEVITVKQGQTYRFRVIGLGVDSMMNFHIANHTSLFVMESDGILVQPIETDHLELNTAQRYSVLITMDHPIGNYEIRTEMIPGGGPANGYAILHYEGATLPVRKIERPGTTPDIELDAWILQKLHPNPAVYQTEVYPIPLTYAREIIIESQQAESDDKGGVRFLINGKMYTEDKIPLINQLQSGNVDFKNQEPKIFEILIGKSVQIVFQNTFSDDGECEQHPWHMHGHSFYIIGQGSDQYDHDRDAIQLDRNARAGNLELRDVTTVYVNHTISDEEILAKDVTGGTPCGWQAIRFHTNNPGLWIVHCHLIAHMDLGKKFLLYAHDDVDPKLLFPCGSDDNGDSGTSSM